MVAIKAALTLVLDSRFDVFLLKRENGDSALRDIFCRMLGATEPVRVNFAPNISRMSRLPLAAGMGM